MIASDQGSITQQKESRSTDQASLQSHLDFLKEIATACDFMAANFESRMAERAGCSIAARSSQKLQRRNLAAARVLFSASFFSISVVHVVAFSIQHCWYFLFTAVVFFGGLQRLDDQ